MIDCSNILNYIKERNRMCEYYEETCEISNRENCPFAKFDCDIHQATQAHIDVLQKWSDEHQPETLQDRFFELFPNAPKATDGTPLPCVKYFGWVKDCPDNVNCKDCWKQPYIEEAEQCKK